MTVRRLRLIFPYPAEIGIGNSSPNQSLADPREIHFFAPDGTLIASGNADLLTPEGIEEPAGEDLD